MSNYESDIDDDFEYEDTGNDAMKQLRKANRAKEKELAELKAQLAELATERRERTIRDVFASRGVNDKIAKFVPKDIDLNEESLSAWIDENSEVFGIQTTNPNQQPNVPAGYQDAYRRQQTTLDTAMTGDRERQIQSRMEEAAAQGPEALKAFFAEMAAQGL
jgi:hypothetical protein